MEPMAAPSATAEAISEAAERWWCACGRTACQPYCDGSHRGTGITPVRARRASAAPECAEAGNGAGIKGLSGQRWSVGAPERL